MPSGYIDEVRSSNFPAPAARRRPAGGRKLRCTGEVWIHPAFASSLSLSLLNEDKVEKGLRSIYEQIVLRSERIGKEEKAPRDDHDRSSVLM